MSDSSTPSDKVSGSKGKAKREQGENDIRAVDISDLFRILEIARFAFMSEKTIVQGKPKGTLGDF